MLYPVLESSHYEVLVSACREAPGLAVGVNNSSVQQEQPPLQVLGRTVASWEWCECLLPTFQALGVGGGLGARGLQLAEPHSLVETLSGKWSSHNRLLVQSVVSRMCAEVSDWTYILGCQLNCLRRKPAVLAPSCAQQCSPSMTEGESTGNTFSLVPLPQVLLCFEPWGLAGRPGGGVHSSGCPQLPCFHLDKVRSEVQTHLRYLGTEGT